MKKVAVITATRNRAGSPERPGYLEPCIRSVCDQDYENHVHVVVDDGSVDATPDLVEFYADRDPRIVYLRREKPDGERMTASIAQNMGIDAVMNPDKYGKTDELGGVECVAMLHSDDLLPPHSLGSRVEAMEDNARDACVYGAMNIIRECDCSRVFLTLRPQPSMGSMDLNQLYMAVSRRVIPFPNHTMLWKKGFLSYVGTFDPDLSLGEDFDMSLTTMKKAMSIGCGMTAVDQPVYYYRSHSDSITGMLGKSTIKADRQRIREKHHDIPSQRALMLRRLVRRPHSFLPEPVKKILRPVRDYFRGAAGSVYTDGFAEEMAGLGSDFWDSRKARVYV